MSTVVFSPPDLGRLRMTLPTSKLPQFGNEVLVVFHIAAVPGAPCAVGVIQFGGLSLGPGIGYEAVLRRLSDFVAFVVVSVGSINDRLQRIKELSLQQNLSLQHPVQDCALNFRLAELHLQALVLLPLLEMLIKRDNQHTSAGE